MCLWSPVGGWVYIWKGGQYTEPGKWYLYFLSTTEIIVDSHVILVWAAITEYHGWLKQ